MLKFALFVALIIGLSPLVSATVFMEPDPAVSTSHADYVTDVVVVSEEGVSQSGVGCGSEYNARVIASIKGSLAPGDEVTFGYLVGLEVGKTYRVYLHNDPDGNRMEEMTRSRTYPGQDPEPFIRACKGRYKSKKIFFRSDRKGEAK